LIFRCFSAWPEYAGMPYGMLQAGPPDSPLLLICLMQQAPFLSQGQVIATQEQVQHFRAAVPSTSPVSSPQPTPTARDPGGRWLVSILGYPHDGWPRYTQASAPHERGRLEAATGTTREATTLRLCTFDAPDPVARGADAALNAIAPVAAYAGWSAGLAITAVPAISRIPSPLA
jgi:hypothetical protein